VKDLKGETHTETSHNEETTVKEHVEPVMAIQEQVAPVFVE
jgi:hypothetical protein